MTCVEQLKKVKKNYEVTIREADLKTKVHLASEDLVVEYRLVKGKTLTVDTYHRFLADLVIDPAFQKAKAALCRGPKSHQEIEKLMAPFALEDKAKDQVLRKLAHQGWLDEGSACEKLVDQYVRMKHLGKEKVRFLLAEKGYPLAMIAKNLGDITQAENEKNLLLWFEKKVGTLAKKSFQGAKQTLAQFLLSKGFPLSEVLAFLDHHEQELRASVDEEASIRLDLKVILKKIDKQDLDPFEKHQKIIQALSRKGYAYSLIKKML